jgi:hypothetical protein
MHVDTKNMLLGGSLVHYERMQNRGVSSLYQGVLTPTAAPELTQLSGREIRPVDICPDQNRDSLNRSVRRLHQNVQIPTVAPRFVELVDRVALLPHTHCLI